MEELSRQLLDKAASIAELYRATGGKKWGNVVVLGRRRGQQTKGPGKGRALAIQPSESKSVTTDRRQPCVHEPLSWRRI